ncbi:hypothetical protein ACLB1O_10235 [Escherichia coli]
MRVSYFAQQLGTPYPISVAALCRRWSRLAVNPAICLINLKPGKHLAPGFLSIAKTVRTKIQEFRKIQFSAAR